MIGGGGGGGALMTDGSDKPMSNRIKYSIISPLVELTQLSCSFLNLGP